MTRLTRRLWLPLLLLLSLTAPALAAGEVEVLRGRCELSGLSSNGNGGTSFFSAI